MSDLISFTSSVEELPDGFADRNDVIEVSKQDDDEEGKYEITVDISKLDTENCEYIH